MRTGPYTAVRDGYADTSSNNDGSPSDLKYALESPTERALARARYQGPSPLPAVLLANRGRTPSSISAARRRRGVFHCRHRAALSRDLCSLADSIGEVGLLRPVVVTPEGRLIAGQRRVEACRLLGWAEVPVTVVDLYQAARGEAHENFVRKDLLPSEIVALKRAIEPLERREARAAGRTSVIPPLWRKDRGMPATRSPATWEWAEPPLSGRKP